MSEGGSGWRRKKTGNVVFRVLISDSLESFKVGSVPVLGPVPDRE